jgi:hypothetical protein
MKTNFEKVAAQADKDYRDFMETQWPASERAVMCRQLIQQLIDLAPHDETVMHHAYKIREALEMPMVVVLDKLRAIFPELTIEELSEMLGVTRQAWYLWADGRARPEGAVAEKLALITGFDAYDISARVTR